MSARIFLFLLFAAALCAPSPAFADTNSDIAALKAAVATLQAQVAALEKKTAPLSVQTDTTRIDGRKYTELYISKANLHIVNGLGTTNGTSGTDTTTHVNGLGNVIIGYNGLRMNSADTNFRTGSHNLIVGDGQNYSSYGGLLGGIFSTASGSYAITGGYRNTASGFAASATGGNNNVASGAASSVTGGGSNQATSYFASVGGGQNIVESTMYGWAAGDYHTP